MALFAQNRLAQGAHNFISHTRAHISLTNRISGELKRKDEVEMSLHVRIGLTMFSQPGSNLADQAPLG